MCRNGFLFLSSFLIAGLAANFQGIQIGSEQLHHTNLVQKQLVAHNLDQEAHRGSGRREQRTAVAEKQLLAQYVDQETAHRGSGRKDGRLAERG